MSGGDLESEEKLNDASLASDSEQRALWKRKQEREKNRSRKLNLWETKRATFNATYWPDAEVKMHGSVGVGSKQQHEAKLRYFIKKKQKQT